MFAYPKTTRWKKHLCSTDKGSVGQRGNAAQCGVIEACLVTLITFTSTDALKTILLLFFVSRKDS